MDKATVESVMALAFELARIREQHGAQSGMYLSEVRALRAEAERLAAQAARDDAALYQTIGERDNYHKWADKLADGIATHLGIDIGEHTAGMGSAESNNPWANALEAIQSADPPACPNCRGSGCVQQMTGHLGPDDYEETVDCPHCNGNQTLGAAYEGVLKSLRDEREAHTRTRSIIWGWTSSRSEVNAVQHKLGNILEHLKPGNIAWVGDRLRDLIASAAAQPSQAPVVQAVQAVELIEQEMAMLIRRLCSTTANDKTRAQAMEYLFKRGHASPLRAESAPAQAMDHPPLPEGVKARFKCEDCDGTGYTGEMIPGSEFQPPEPVGCTSCRFTGWWAECEAYSADQMHAYLDADRASSGAAQAVRMLTDGEIDAITDMHNTGRSQGAYDCAIELLHKFCAVNGLRIPADGKIGSAA